VAKLVEKHLNSSGRGPGAGPARPLHNTTDTELIAVQLKASSKDAGTGRAV
jgi:glutamate transport system permease protein